MRVIAAASVVLALALEAAFAQVDTDEAFVRNLLQAELGTIPEVPFDPGPTIVRLRLGNLHEYWVAPDPREPGMTNHYQRWRVPSFALQVHTWFSANGPVTIFDFVEISTESISVPPSLLDDPRLESRRFLYDQVRLGLIRDAEGQVVRIRIERAEH